MCYIDNCGTKLGRHVILNLSVRNLDKRIICLFIVISHLHYLQYSKHDINLQHKSLHISRNRYAFVRSIILRISCNIQTQQGVSTQDIAESCRLFALSSSISEQHIALLCPHPPIPDLLSTYLTASFILASKLTSSLSLFLLSLSLSLIWTDLTDYCPAGL